VRHITPARLKIQLKDCGIPAAEPFANVTVHVHFFNDTTRIEARITSDNGPVIPEPTTILGSLTLLGFGTLLKRQKAR
jgi:hypothetical protein